MTLKKLNMQWRMVTGPEIQALLQRSEELLNASKDYVTDTQIRRARRAVKRSTSYLTKSLRHLRMLTKMLEGHGDVNPNAPGAFVEEEPPVP